jgi:hypothetical protein
MRQRTPPDPDRLEPVAPWAPDRVSAEPTGFGGAAPPPPEPPDWYVVVDELDEIGCRLAIDGWPDRDADGRLVFDDGEQLVSVPPAAFHEVVTAARTAQGDEAPDRPLRIGDTFAWWWGPSARGLFGFAAPPRHREGLADPDVEMPDVEVPGVEVIDVTRAARRATNAAAQATAGGVLTTSQLTSFDLASPDDEVAGPGGGP